jgi:hypothetical protein
LREQHPNIDDDFGLFKALHLPLAQDVNPAFCRSKGGNILWQVS